MSTQHAQISPKLARERADRIVADLAAGADPKVAHEEADRLIVDILHGIADSNPDSWVRLMVEQALRVVEAPGQRWYAREPGSDTLMLRWSTPRLITGESGQPAQRRAPGWG
jgi:hypothetical protein